MVTALVLQLIQCVVHLPNDRDMFEECDKVGIKKRLLGATQAVNMLYVWYDTFLMSLFLSG